MNRSQGHIHRDAARLLKLSDALIREISWNKPQGVAELLAKGAAPDALDAHGRSALSLALRLGHLSCAEALIAAGANPSLVFAQGDSALIDIAAACARPKALESLSWLLKQKPDLDHANKIGFSALGAIVAQVDEHRVCASIAAAKALLEAGADADAGRLPPLYSLACGRLNPEALPLAALLLEHGADPHAPGQESMTPLAVARMMDNAPLARLMIVACESRELAAATPLAAIPSASAPRL